MKLNCLLFLLIITYWGFAQKHFVSTPKDLNNDFFGYWITHPEAKGDAFEVFYFKRMFVLVDQPEEFIVHVSADSRYKLYVNGQKVGFGPATGDLAHWNYETYDLAPYLKSGNNVVSAHVWNWGKYRGQWNISHHTGFVLQANSEREKVLTTNRQWFVIEDDSYLPKEHTSEEVGGGYIAGPADIKLVCRTVNDVFSPDFDKDKLWKYARTMGKANHAGQNHYFVTPWCLTPRTIPFPEQKDEAIPSMKFIKGMEYQGEYDGNLKIEIPANTEVEILLDNEELTMGYPKLNISGGDGSEIKIQYQETLFNPDGSKGNRNDTEGKIMKGYSDLIFADGRKDYTFEPLWIRTFRYINLTIKTKNEPLQINTLHNTFTAYPFEQNGSFSSGVPKLDSIWDISWRTARLCANETYMDCPYYEQLQYVGDTRIQALVSMAVSGDDRLMRAAIEHFKNSFVAEGLTQSRYPTNFEQIIPPFSLKWILMVHDYLMFRGDKDFIDSMLPEMERVLTWFDRKIDDTGMLGPLKYWTYVDAADGFFVGSPPDANTGNSAVISMLYALSMKKTIEILNYLGYKQKAEIYQIKSDSLLKAIKEKSWDNNRQLFADTPNKTTYSQHVNILAILCDAVDEVTQKRMAEKLITEDDLLQAQIYFQSYLAMSMQKAGYGNYYLKSLGAWENMMKDGLTTFAENTGNVRSDCHAWSASPMYFFLSLVCGIQPAGPGFENVLISPNPGNLLEFSGKFPHPKGLISTQYRVKNGNLYAEINLPEGLTGKYKYNNKEYNLKSGINKY